MTAYNSKGKIGRKTMIKSAVLSFEKMVKEQCGNQIGAGVVNRTSTSTTSRTTTKSTTVKTTTSTTAMTIVTTSGDSNEMSSNEDNNSGGAGSVADANKAVLMMPLRQWVLKGQLLTTITNFDNYNIKFDLWIVSFPSEVVSILHFGNNKETAMPAVHLLPSKHLQISVDQHNNFLWPDLQSDRWYSIEITKVSAKNSGETKVRVYSDFTFKSKFGFAECGVPMQDRRRHQKGMEASHDSCCQFLCECLPQQPLAAAS